MIDLQQAHSFSILNEELLLLPQKALYWERSRMLVISDLHAGKSGHFRKHGIAVPKTVNHKNTDLLDQLISGLDVEIILFLGDLFHSDSNNEVAEFKTWRKQYSGIEMFLTVGNHDILHDSDYGELNLHITESLKAEPFIFLHDYNDLNKGSDLYPVSGHIHPSVKLRGKGRQKAFVPCFYFGKDHGLMPAFGNFTGSYRIRPAQGDHVFAIVADEILHFH